MEVFVGQRILDASVAIRPMRLYILRLYILHVSALGSVLEDLGDIAP